jgi:hypothetical protein
VKLSSETPEIFQYLPYGPFESLDAYDRWYSNRLRSTKAAIIFAIILKAGIIRKRKPGSDEFEELTVEDGIFAGTTGLINADPDNSVVEVGHVGILACLPCKPTHLYRSFSFHASIERLSVQQLTHCS